MYLGRIHPDKGTADAIRVARAARCPIVIAGIVQDRGYFEREVEPFLGTDVRYVGSVGPFERNALLGSAAALLHLIHFDEPFGLSVVEAMACGTPVIAYRRGSMAELVVDGVSGFLVPDAAGAVEAIHRLDTLDRAAVRAHAGRFSVDAMVYGYLAAYHQVLTKDRLPVDRPKQTSLALLPATF